MPYLPSEAQAVVEVASVDIPTYLTISAPGKVRVGESFRVYGSLKDSYGDPLPRRVIQIYVDGNYVGSARTDEGGNYEYWLTLTTPGKHVIKAFFPGEELIIF